MTQLEGFVEKGWGHELIWATNDKYCGKLLKFTKGAKFSMHFHREKDDIWHNPPLLPHQIICVQEGTVIEVSTPDSVEDNYRIAKGDSQK